MHVCIQLHLYYLRMCKRSSQPPLSIFIFPSTPLPDEGVVIGELVAINTSVQLFVEQVGQVGHVTGRQGRGVGCGEMFVGQVGQVGHVTGGQGRGVGGCGEMLGQVGQVGHVGQLQGADVVVIAGGRGRVLVGQVGSDSTEIKAH